MSILDLIGRERAARLGGDGVRIVFSKAEHDARRAAGKSSVFVELIDPPARVDEPPPRPALRFGSYNADSGN